MHTPVISASRRRGRGQHVPGDHARSGVSAKRQARDFTQDFFGKRTYLTVSGQLEAEIFALAFANVYTFGPTFRAENSNTPRHLAEFYMIEPEMAFCDLNDNQDLAEAFLKSQVEQVVNACGADLEFLGQVVRPRAAQDPRRPDRLRSFERITYTEAIALLQKSGKNFEFPTHWGVDLQSEHERYLTEEVFKKPVIVTDYPKEIKAFYMRANDDGKTVAAMDVLAPRIGEIIGGSQREERHDVLLQRIRDMAAHGLKEEAYWWYLDLRRFGGVRARRLRHGLRAHDDVPHRHEEHPRRHPLPAHARQRGVLAWWGQHPTVQLSFATRNLATTTPYGASWNPPSVGEKPTHCRAASRANWGSPIGSPQVTKYSSPILLET